MKTALMNLERSSRKKYEKKEMLNSEKKTVYGKIERCKWCNGYRR